MDLDPLIAVLVEHTPRDPHEAACLRATRSLLSTPRPAHRGQLEPGHLTVSGFVLSPDAAAVLLIHHRSLRLWLQPGGHLEPADRTVERAVRREISEETGLEELDLLSGAPYLHHLDVHDIPPRPARGEGPHRHFDLRLAFRARAATLVASDEVAGARWVPFAELDQIATDDSVRRAVTLLQQRQEQP